MSKLLYEMFGLAEVGMIDAEKELNGSQSVFARKNAGQRKATKDTAQAQADVDSSRSVRREAADDGSDYVDTSPEDQYTEPGSKPFAKPTPASNGLRVSGDKATMNALQEALMEAESSAEPDVAAWAGKAWKAVAEGMRRGGGDVSLPKFEETPAELEPDDDDTAGEDY